MCDRVPYLPLESFKFQVSSFNFRLLTYVTAPATIWVVDKPRSGPNNQSPTIYLCSESSTVLGSFATSPTYPSVLLSPD
ncbi:hypothetical protein LENED_012881 [Lentinula edodes]|uniref:Uncharacterized protein n=1 Tax=Lentinula edodes TaxID=5353 RepID=A0A1Q3ETR9_LENED|nr:hypothetical protein LENED_012881 [Lentinula edodes]